MTPRLDGEEKDVLEGEEDERIEGTVAYLPPEVIRGETRESQFDASNPRFTITI